MKNFKLNCFCIVSLHVKKCHAMNDNANCYFIGPTPFKLTVEDMNTYSINISWSQQSFVFPTLSSQFNLMVSHGSQTDVISTNDTSYLFFPPRNASPCEVYNFSVMHTHIGATYTGSGCGEPGPVLSTMLPTLPNINNLESSIQYSLKQEPNEGIAMRVTFTVSCFFLSRTDCSSLPPYSLDHNYYYIIYGNSLPQQPKLELLWLRYFSRWYCYRRLSCVQNFNRIHRNISELHTSC